MAQTGGSVAWDGLLPALTLLGERLRRLGPKAQAPQIAELKARLRAAETHLEHLAITRKTAPALGDRLPAYPVAPALPEHPDHPRILPAFNEATGPLLARGLRSALQIVVPGVGDDDGLPRVDALGGQPVRTAGGEVAGLHGGGGVGGVGTARTLSRRSTAA
ncbi:hypothetical protein ACFWP3_23575 [Streptomyces sp. NPDC058525]|uniref:hypothetical protein n=1 Tax=Streptomyces sp. NPDC058525 TaxID=3346538 RepID=UPI003662CB3A